MTYPKYDAQSGAAMPESLPTAFVTSLCVDAIETLIDVLRRRWSRLKQLLELLKKLKQLEEDQVAFSYAEEFVEHGKTLLFHEIVDCVSAASRDSALKGLFTEWAKQLSLAKDSKTFTLSIIEECFKVAVKTNVNQLVSAKKPISTKAFKKYQVAIDSVIKMLKSNNVEPSFEWKDLPQGLVDHRFAFASMPVGERLKILKEYWLDHQKSVAKAFKQCNELFGFLTGTIDGQLKFAGLDTDGKPLLTCTAPPSLICSIETAKNTLDATVRGVYLAIAPAVSWSESIMNRHLALARLGRLGDFDAAELAHAARIVTRSGLTKNTSAILDAIGVVCEAQYPDGLWPSTQPFYWTHTGLAAYPHSAEIAWGLVSMMGTLTRDPEMFSLGQVEVLEHMDRANKALERFLGWLNANVKSYALPKLLGEREGWVFGWASDKTPEPSLVHTWATANVAEFLVEFRSYLQQQINAMLRVQFLSYHPSDLDPLSKFQPPDLKVQRFEDRVGIKLWEALRLHRDRTQRETTWIPGADYKEEPKLWSAILAGPPGSSKSFLAKRIAGELQWPLIALSPSDFLSAGEGAVEARAREIFAALGAGSRLVYFFDEIDELILDRGLSKDAHRSVFSFLTPSFLTKLQDLRDTAPRKSFVFLIGTNYLDRIDPAAKRLGRIDRHLLILYADEPSRRGFLFEQIRKGLRESNKLTGEVRVAGVFTEKNKCRINAVARASALLSVPGMLKLCDRIVKRFGKDKLESADWDYLDGLVKTLTEGGDDEVKPEVGLSFYKGRSGALAEWLGMLTLIDSSKRDEEISSYFGHWREKDELATHIQTALQIIDREKLDESLKEKIRRQAKPKTN